MDDMVDVGLPCRVMGRNIKKVGAFFVKNVFLGILEYCYCPPSAPAMSMDAYARPI